MFARLLKWAFTLLLLAITCAVLWLAVAPPALIRVASAYSAKIVCSNVFVAGRDAQQVLAEDVQAPGHWLLNYMRIDVDQQAKSVKAALLGLFGQGEAVAREGLGCTSVSGELNRVANVSVPARAALPEAEIWPQGNLVQPSQDPAVAAILDDPAMTGPGMRAVVVVKDGRIIGERYGEGFSEKTPLLGWSMTKTVNAAIIGTAIKAGKMSVEDKRLAAHAQSKSMFSRAEITVADLMAMSSGFEFNEDYGDVADVTRMLFLEPDMAAFASNKEVIADIGTAFNYSSGTATLLSRLWQDAVGEADALIWPSQKLFEPLGMSSAVLEQDEHGTYVGSSYMYATARDWARFGQFLLQRGVWNGVEILPAEFVGWMAQVAPASNGMYGRGQVWMQGPGDDEKAEIAQGVPADAFWALGHDGQSTAIIPSRQLVIVRLGLTPSKLGYRPENMAAALVKALGP